MNVSLETSIHFVASLLNARIAPALDDEFAIETTRLSAMLLAIAGNAVDDAAALRVDENAAMRVLFAEAGGIVADADLAVSLAEAGGSSEPGLRISELDAENDRLRTILIALHRAADERTDDAACALSQRIWRMLQAFEARRAPNAQVPVTAG